MKNMPKPEVRRRELLRVGGLSVGRLDAHNYYTARVHMAGDETKHAGEDRLSDMTFHLTLELACREAAFRVADEAAARTLREYADELRAVVAQITTALESANAARSNERQAFVEPRATRRPHGAA